MTLRDTAVNVEASMAKRSEPSEELPFEAALERLENLVQRLEGGELPLESALEAFEEGVALTRRCAEQLERAERRIEALVLEGGRLVERPHAPDEEAE